jgi:CRISPR-associated protein Csm2
MNFQEKWIKGKNLVDGKNGIDEDTITFAANFGKNLADIQFDDRPSKAAMTTTQIRNFFGEVKRIQANGGYEGSPSDFHLIRPKLAYAEARVKAKQGTTKVSDFRKVIEEAHKCVKNNEQFQNFVDFMEAILAYHKASGGRE